MPLHSEKEILPLYEDLAERASGDLLRYGNDFITFEKDVWIAGSAAATAANWPVFSVPATKCFLLEARCWYDVAGGANAVLDVQKLSESSARGSGVSMLESTFDLTATARTVYKKGPAATLANAQVDPTSDEMIELVSSGTIAGLDDLAVTLLFGVLLRNIPVSKNL